MTVPPSLSTAWLQNVGKKKEKAKGRWAAGSSNWTLWHSSDTESHLHDNCDDSDSNRWSESYMQTEHEAQAAVWSI